LDAVVAQCPPLGRLKALPTTNQKTTMSITRDRELADLLYNSIQNLLQLQEDLKILNGHDKPQDQAVTVVDPKAPVVDELLHPLPEPSEEAKALNDAIKKISILIRNQEQIIKLLIQNHTDASSVINEFEKIRTAKLLNSETFALGHLIPTIQK
jgi:hypothetical protein